MFTTLTLKVNSGQVRGPKPVIPEGRKAEGGGSNKYPQYIQNSYNSTTKIKQPN